MRLLPPLRLTGATILRDGELRQRSVAIQRGRIGKGPLPAVDLDGYLILPGIIDLMALPPPVTGPASAGTVLAEAQAQAAAAGITTAWLAAGWSWAGSREGAERAPALLAALNRFAGPLDLRAALRVEVTRTETGPDLVELIGAQRPQLLYFENRRDQLAELRLIHPASFLEEAEALGLAPARLAEALETAQGQRRDIPRHLCRIAEAMDAVGGSYGSLDDSGGDVRETYSMIGARLATCPAAYAAAAAARAMDNPVLVGAGAGGVADDLIRGGLASALVSRGEWPRMVGRVLALAGRDLALLPKYWPLVSSRPAEIMGLADRGTLDYGRRADLVVIHRETGAVEATIAAGRIAHLTGQARARFEAAFAGPELGATAAE